MFFLYDENGQLYGFVKDEKKYFYIKDITGTILGIVNESGTLVGKYEYSAYGKCTVLVDIDKIATINPFRFKCYYYDTESGMYYCQTRYFVPEWGRWLNADHASFLQFDNINGMNLFAYCGNSPVMYADPSGHFALTTFLIGLGISMLTWGVVNVATQLGSDLVNLALTGDWESGWEDYAGAFLGGLAGGATFFLTHGNLSATFSVMGGAETLFTSSLTNLTGKTNYSDYEILGKTLFSMGLGFLSGRFIKGTKYFGITRGGNSFMSVWKSGLSKLFNGTATRMSFNVFMKGLLSTATLRYGSIFVNGLIGSALEWGRDIFIKF